MAAMPVRRRLVRRSFRSAPRRRPTSWATAAQNNVAVGAGSNAIHDILGSFTLASATATMGTTVVRTIMTFRWEATNLADFLTIGLVISTDAAEADDVNPDAFSGLSWALLTRVYPTSSGVTPDANSVHHFDIRAQRKLGNFDNRYLLAIHNPSGTPRNYSFYARSLVKLP